ncbi:MAG: GNAT family N-acetyltransferase [Mangrovicoccus sp.]|nr:GNAT family N-acetyltransferase [Mangrovicoccus sp.]
MSPDEMAALHGRCFTMPRPWSAAEFAALCSDAAVLSALSPAGFALGRAVAGEAELLTLAVAPEARRQGAGRALLAEYESQARAHGAAESFLEVAVDNDGAIALYRRAGYVEAGQRRGYFRGPDGARVDALVMRRSL